MNEIPCCENCKFWCVDPANKNMGWCRKYPPKVVLVQTYQTETYFPHVSFDNWCGEHKFIQNDTDLVYADLLEENGFAAAAYFLRNR